MKGYQFVAEAGIGYRAVLPGALLEAAKTTERMIPIKGKAGEEVNLTKTGWLMKADDTSAPWPIRGKHFDPGEAYLVYYVPDATPPYLFEIKLT